jgi:hypothetical protein
MAKNYIKGSFRQVTTSQGEVRLIASILVSDLEKIKNDKGYAQVVIQQRQDKDQYGNTHYAFENDWKPEKRAEVKAAKIEKLNPPKFDESIDDLPF